jgi:hypothetical protein
MRNVQLFVEDVPADPEARIQRVIDLLHLHDELRKQLDKALTDAVDGGVTFRQLKDRANVAKSFIQRHVDAERERRGTPRPARRRTRARPEETTEP